jgi:S-formylglutathione hydrolase FrmB
LSRKTCGRIYLFFIFIAAVCVMIRITQTYGGTAMVLNCRYYSTVLYRNVEFNVLIPTPTSHGGQLRREPFKVLYLLHGLHGDAHSWLHRSNIQRHIEEIGDFIIVMPDGQNSFYQDMAQGEKFFTYLTQELPEYIQSIFPVSRKREDTFVAGLSMGGYGAWLLALSCPQKYAAAASLSGALDMGFRVSPPIIPQGVPIPECILNASATSERLPAPSGISWLCLKRPRLPA